MERSKPEERDISPEGRRLLTAQVETLKKANASGTSEGATKNKGRTEVAHETYTYYGVGIPVRYDATEKNVNPRVEIAEGYDISTVKIAQHIIDRAWNENQGKEGYAESNAQFMSGLRAAEDSVLSKFNEPERTEKIQKELDNAVDSSDVKIGVRLRALARLSDPKTTDEQQEVITEQLRTATTLGKAANLFLDPRYQTGALPSQNSGPVKVAEFTFAGEVTTSGSPLVRKTRAGTIPEETAHARKYNAMIASLQPEPVTTTEAESSGSRDTKRRRK